jgi:hypothetical protein
MSVRDDLKAYLDGELPPLRMQEVREAAERDPELARELAELQALSLAVRQSAPEYEVRGMEETLRRLSRRRAPKLIWLGIPVALAGAVAVAAVLFNPNAADRGGFLVAMQPRAMAKNVAERTEMAGEAGAATEAAVAPQPRSEAFRDAAKRPTIEPQKKDTELFSVDGRTKARSRAQHEMVAKAQEPSIKGAAKVTATPSNGLFDGAAPASHPVDQNRKLTGSLPTGSAAKATLMAEAEPEPKPLVLTVVSLAEAEAKLREAMASFDATIGPEEKKSKDSLERRLLLEVPESRAEEALAAIKELAKPLGPNARLAFANPAADAARDAQGQAAKTPPPVAARSVSPLSPAGPVGGAVEGRSVRKPQKAEVSRRKIVILIRQKPMKKAPAPEPEPDPETKASPGNLQP